MMMDPNSTIDNNNNASNGIQNSSVDSSDELFMDTYLSMVARIVCMVANALSLILLLLPYALMKKVKGTTLGKLMKSYCILALLALFAAFLHTLMEFVIPVNNAICSITTYFLFCMFLGAVICKVLFLFHIGYIFYCSYKMILKDMTVNQLFRLKIGYFLTITIIPLIMLLIITIHNHVLNEIKFAEGDKCIFTGDVDRFTFGTLITFIVCVHLVGVVIIITLTFLLRKAYTTQKAVGQDVKNLFRIAVGIAVAFGMAWIVFAFRPLYVPVGPLVFYPTAAIENLVIISVFFYNNKILTKIKIYITIFKCHDDNSDIV